ncbi:MAG: hypothetical protein WCT08_05960 [Patescibacteria group bacterium]|jgi:Ca2+:H+ antiporter
MAWIFWVVIITLITSAIGRFFLNSSEVNFISSAISLIFISKLLGEATQHLARYLGQKKAGLLNVTLSNLPEIIIIYAAIRANQIELVQGGIVGSIIGNLLLVLGFSIILGCKKNGTMKFQASTGTYFITQLMVVGVTLLLPSLFANRIPVGNQQIFSNLLSYVLIVVYLCYFLFFLDKERMGVVNEQAEKMDGTWSKKASLATLIIMTAAAYWQSENLVMEVEAVSQSLNISKAMIGFIILPVLGNIAEHVSAIMSARKGLIELSLAISVGSASQVGMIVAPLAVILGTLTGNPITLNFAGLPFGLLAISLVATYIVLRDNKWNMIEGIMLIVLYFNMTLAFFFAQ